MKCDTLKVRVEEDVCYIQIYRPDYNNTINEVLVKEFHKVLDECEEAIKIVVIEGLPDVFCFGADFQEIHNNMAKGKSPESRPEEMYDLCLRLATGPYITISYVRGKVNAGGMGLVSACDIVLADDTAQFGLSELLFGVFPAIVLPFLTRRIGIKNSNYLTIMTQPISAKKAHEIGLVDEYQENINVLRRHILRLRPLSKKSIIRYKKYINSLDTLIYDAKMLAINANKEIFSDSDNLRGIYEYIEKGKLPWER